MQLVTEESTASTPYFIQIGSFLVLSLLSAWWAYKKKIFSSLENPDFAKGATHQNYKKVKWFHLLAGFATLIFVQIFLLGLLVELFPSLINNSIHLGWTVVLVNILLALFLYFYLKREKLGAIVYYKHTYIKQGLQVLLVSLPWVFLTSVLSRLFVVEVLGRPPVEQNPITFLQSFDLSMPVFYAVAISIFTIIPFNEEVLFRGLFQNFTTKVSNKWVGLTLTPIFFTLVHFQFGQGLSNIELLTPLFVLACFLSYLYYKTGSLLATIAFHMSFNFLSVIGLFLEKITS